MNDIFNLQKEINNIKKKYNNDKFLINLLNRVILTNNIIFINCIITNIKQYVNIKNYNKLINSTHEILDGDTLIINYLKNIKSFDNNNFNVFKLLCENEFNPLIKNNLNEDCFNISLSYNYPNIKLNSKIIKDINNFRLLIFEYVFNYMLKFKNSLFSFNNKIAKIKKYKINSKEKLNDELNEEFNELFEDILILLTNNMYKFYNKYIDIKILHKLFDYAEFNNINIDYLNFYILKNLNDHKLDKQNCMLLYAITMLRFMKKTEVNTNIYIKTDYKKKNIDSYYDIKNIYNFDNLTPLTYMCMTINLIYDFQREILCELIDKFNCEWYISCSYKVYNPIYLFILNLNYLLNKKYTNKKNLDHIIKNALKIINAFYKTNKFNNIDKSKYCNSNIDFLYQINKIKYCQIWKCIYDNLTNYNISLMANINDSNESKVINMINNIKYYYKNNHNGDNIHNHKLDEKIEISEYLDNKINQQFEEIPYYCLIPYFKSETNIILFKLKYIYEKNNNFKKEIQILKNNYNSFKDPLWFYCHSENVFNTNETQKSQQDIYKLIDYFINTLNLSFNSEYYHNSYIINILINRLSIYYYKFKKYISFINDMEIAKKNNINLIKNINNIHDIIIEVINNNKYNINIELCWDDYRYIIILTNLCMYN